MTRPSYPAPVDLTTQAESVRQRQLARAASTAILQAFDNYLGQFAAISRRARQRFERCEWRAMQEDAIERLAVRETVLGHLVDGMREMMSDHVGRIDTWLAIKHIYATLIGRRDEVELAETFFNSVTRRVLGTVGVDQRLEFVWFGATMLSARDQGGVFRRYVRITDTTDTISTILTDFEFDTPYADKRGDASRVASIMDKQLLDVWESVDFESIEMLKSVFYRNKGAYLIGRIRRRNWVLPIILPLLHAAPNGGVTVDAALLSEDEASRVFSFTRSYFHVDAENPTAVVGFLKSMLPLKPIAELYTALGYHKHGKTMLYRALYRHLGNSSDRFEIAPGARGMVMTVFTLPSYDVVFKIIKDKFAPPKTATRQEVMERYHFVFKHDRVGRMVDAQEFENLSFERERFSEALLQELQTTAANTVTITDNEVIIKHLYTERRLYPLDLYIKEKGFEKARAAIIDYGHAIADLAAANIFPGDLFIKNFGVTRHGRVVFYDYDELCLLTECNFRLMPAASGYDDEMADTPWFSVRTNDIFPEEFRTFLWLPKPLREVFEREHGYLFTVDWWKGMQERNRAGEVLDIFPYSAEQRFGH